MRAVAFIFVASIAVALLQRVIVALILVLALSVLWGLFHHPREMFGLLCLGLFADSFRLNPWAGAASIALVALIAWFVRDDE